MIAMMQQHLSHHGTAARNNAAPLDPDSFGYYVLRRSRERFGQCGICARLLLRLVGRVELAETFDRRIRVSHERHEMSSDDYHSAIRAVVVLRLERQRDNLTWWLPAAEEENGGWICIGEGCWRKSRRGGYE